MIIKLISISKYVLAIFGFFKANYTKQLLVLDKKMAKGQYHYVIQKGEEIVRRYPGSFKAWSVLGWAYLKTDQLEQAEQCFDKCISINDRWDNAYVGKGVLYRMQERTDQARQNYLKAISIVPQNAEAYSSLSVIEIMEGNYEKAKEYAEKAWTLRKNLASIPANLAIAYHYLGNFEKRDEYYKYAKSLKYHDLESLKEIFAMVKP